MPNLLTQKKFDFVSQSPELAPDAFTVVEFSGFEGFSTCYQFEITLVGVDPEIDIAGVLAHPATFTILRDEGDIPFHGILTEFEQLHAIDDYVVYKTVLAPKLWWLSLTRHNQVFLDKTVPEVLAAVLTDGGLTPNDFELRLMDEGAYEPWEFICQYGESHLNFVSRWMEREGMYFYFEQGPSGEKAIITDTAMSHQGMDEGRTMYYSPPSGLDEPFREEVIHAFVCKQKLLPGKVHVQDYNYRTPSLNLTAEAEVSAWGRGEFHIYGDHFRTLQEGTRLADMRSQELRSHEKRFHGESTIPYLRPGYLFDLERHYRESFNQQYLTIELSHAGSQTGFLISGIGRTLSESEKRPYYRNSFVAIPAEVQYRHPQQTQKPRFYGTINASVDAESSGEYAELDEQGRYKIRLPFDLSGSPDGRASHWIRMAQPYAGENQGMHFPLHKRTEVLLTFIEGDPDRPIIAAAVPNPESPSPVNHLNQSKSFIKTGRGPKTASVGAAWQTDFFNFLSDNYIELEDQSGEERIGVHTPGDLWLESNAGYGEYHNDGAAKISNYPSDRPKKIQAMLNKFGKSYNPQGHQSYGVGGAHFRVSNFDTFNTQEGNIYDFGGYWNYNLGNCYVETHMKQDDSVELNKRRGPDNGFDMLSPGGPSWKSWSGVKDSSNELKAKGKGSWDNGSVWVEKTFNGSTYNYNHKTPSLEINYLCSTQEINVGGRHIEETYTGDLVRTSYSWSESGESEEYKYNRETGDQIAYEHSKWIGGGGTKKTTSWSKFAKITEDTNYNAVASTSKNFGAVASASMNFAAVASAETNLAAKTSNQLNVGGSSSISIDASLAFSLTLAAAGSLDIGVKVGIPIDLDVYLSPIAFEFKTGASFGIEMDLRPSWKLEFDASNKKFDLKGPGTEFQKQADLKADIQSLIIKDAKGQLENRKLDVKKLSAQVESGKINLQETKIFFHI